MTEVDRNGNYRVTVGWNGTKKVMKRPNSIPGGVIECLEEEFLYILREEAVICVLFRALIIREHAGISYSFGCKMSAKSVLNCII